MVKIIIGMSWGLESICADAAYICQALGQNFSLR